MRKLAFSMSDKSLQTKERIYASMVELMGKHGYHGVSVDEIAADAGVAKGTIYYHYKGKAEMMEALMIDRLSPLVDAFDTAAEQGSIDAEAALRNIIELELEFLINQRSFARLLITELWREDRGWRNSLIKLRTRLVSTIEQVLALGVEQGAFRVIQDIHFVASAVFGIAATSALDYLAFDQGQAAPDVVSNVMRLVFFALNPEVSTQKIAQ